MIFLVILLITLVVALLRGGKLSNLAALKIRWRGLILTGFFIQVVIFSRFWQTSELQSFTQLAYLASLTILLVAVLVNRHVPGILIITSGFLLNFVVIAANGGYMPASADAMPTAGMPVLSPGQISNNSIGMSPETPLAFLADIFAIPKGFILPNVFSIGDILIAIGAVYLIQKGMVVSTPSQ